MAAGTKHYSAELKRDAVTMVVELVGQGSTEWAAMKKTADLLGVGAAETVRQWVRKAPGAGAASVSSGGASADTAEEVRRLRKEVAELKRANGMADSSGGRKELCELL